MSDTRLEPDLDDPLGSPSISSTAPSPASRAITTTTSQKRCQQEQDASEICSVELERLVAEGLTLIARRDCLEIFRDQA